MMTQTEVEMEVTEADKKRLIGLAFGSVIILAGLTIEAASGGRLPFASLLLLTVFAGSAWSIVKKTS
jgi:hypothetical protein